jgi:Domain of unknown function (DUF1929)/Glyoxal oxidase N-terminus
MSQLSRRALLGALGAAGTLSALELVILSGPSVGQRAAAAMGAGGSAFTGVGRGGIYVQTGIGTTGDYALAVPGVGSGAVTSMRLNDQGAAFTPVHWTAGTPTAVEGLSAIWSNYNHLEFAQVVQGVVQTWWRNDADEWTRYTDAPAASGGATGWPALLQTTYGTFGDFALVVPQKNGGLMLAWRRNDINGGTWQAAGSFGTGTYQGVGAAQSSFLTNGKGNLEVVAVTAAGTMEVWYWNGTWNKAATVGSGLTGAPVVIQSKVGTPGRLEVLVPLASGGLQWWTRESSGTFAWTLRATFGTAEKFWAAGLTIGPYGPSTDNNLEAAGYGPAGLSIFYRGSDYAWVAGGSPYRTSASPQTLGKADGTVDLGAVGILSTLLPTGKAMLIGFKPYDQFADAQYRLYDPVSRAVSTPAYKYDTFCAGLDSTADSNVLIAGGHSADAIAGVFLIDPVRGTQYRYPDMPQGRWYPTVTTLADGSTLVIAGSLTVGVSGNRNSSYQVWNPVTRTLTGQRATPVPFSSSWPSGDTLIHWYPFVFQLPDGRVMVHSRNTTRMLTDVGKATWDPKQWQSPSGLARTYPHDGAAVILPLRHQNNHAFSVMICGGTAGAAPANGTVAPGTPATATAEIFDPVNGWRSTGSMTIPRLMHDSVLLPDGTVFVVGGGSYGHNDVCSRPVIHAEIFNPAMEKWTRAGDTTVPRGYHGTALLLPDGSVALAGRDAEYQPGELQYLEKRLEVFKPSYFYRGTRPTLSGTPSSMKVGSSYSVTSTVAAGASVKDVVLIRVGSVTHGNNMGQRMVTAPFTVSGNTVSFTLPTNANLLPPGAWMVFIVDSAGIPSVAQLTNILGTGALAAPWRAFASVPAAISQTASVVTLSAAGADVWGNQDQFACAYSRSAVSSGGTVVARLLSQTSTDPWAKAGVFLRNDATLTGKSTGYVILVRTPGNGLSLQWDSDGSGTIDSYVTAAPGIAAKVHLRLTRSGASTVTAHYSLDGATWTQVGTTVSLAGSAAKQDAGIIMTSHSTATGTATFDGLSTT